MATTEHEAAFEGCGVNGCKPGAECPTCCMSIGAGCDRSEVHAPGTAPYAVGRDSEGDFVCAGCKAADEADVTIVGEPGTENHPLFAAVRAWGMSY